MNDEKRVIRKPARTAAITILVSAMILFAGQAIAQNQETIKVVQFKDGTAVTGKILEMNIYTIKVQAADGSVVVRRFDDIASIQNKEELAAVRPLLPVHSLDIGFEAFYKKYDEPDIMNERGMMYGVSLAYTYHKEVMFKGSLLVAYGEVDYDSNGTGTLNGIPNHHWELRGLIGYDFRVDASTFITPYIGLGFRVLRDDGSGLITSTGHSAYNRQSNYYYSPVGVSLIKVIPEGWTFSAEAEFDYLWSGKQESDLSNASPAYPDVTNTQNQGYGFRGSIRIEKQFTYTSVFFEPFIRYWHISQSDTQYFYVGASPRAGYEPKNETTEAGGIVGIRF